MRTFHEIEKAGSIARAAGVPLILTPDEVLRMMTQVKYLAIHLVTVMGVALDNMSYAPSSDEAGEQYDKITAARDYLVAQGFVKPGELI